MSCRTEMNVLRIVALVLFAQPAFSAFEPVTQGSTVVALGGTAVARRDDLWGSLVNPAQLPSLTEAAVGFYHAPQPFGLSELARSSVVAAMPTGWGTLGAAASRFGFALYNESVFSLSYGVNATDRLSFGVTVDYDLLVIRNYGRGSTIGVDAGIIVGLGHNFSWGFSALNLNAPAIGESNEKLPQVVMTGLRYRPFQAGAMEIDLQKDVRYSPELHIGAEYTILDVLSLRGGAASELSAYSAGVGIAIGPVQADYAVVSHLDLGLSHTFSVTIRLAFL